MNVANTGKVVLKIFLKLLLALLALLFLTFAIFRALIFDWRIALAACPLYILVIVLFVAWCLPARLRRRVLIASACIGVAALIVLLSVAGVKIYERAITVSEPEVSTMRYTSENRPSFSGVSDPLFEDDGPALLTTNTVLPLTSAVYSSVYPDEYPFNAFDDYGENGRFMVNRSPSLFLEEGRVDVVIDLDHRGRRYDPEIEGAVWTPFAREALVVFVNENNSVTNLTSQQLKGIFTGEITNWSNVGGEDREIEVYTYHSVTTPADILEYYMGAPLSGYETERRLAFPYFVFNEYEAEYRNTRGAIGFAFKSMLKYYGGVHAVSIDGVTPDEENISAGEYALTQDVCAVTYGAPDESESLLIDFLLSDSGREVISSAGYSPIQ